jgi:hypothetical protein
MQGSAEVNEKQAPAHSPLPTSELEQIAARVSNSEFESDYVA